MPQLHEMIILPITDYACMSRHRAKKNFGQHFLIQSKIAERIVEHICRTNPPRLLEIGPGMGALTQLLIEKVHDFKAIEADIDMVHRLTERFPSLRDCIIFSDVLKHDLAQTFDGLPFHICGNFPYNISSQIVFRVLDSMRCVPVMTGMFQREMAERLVAKPSSKAYGILSVLCQRNFDARICFDVAPGNFSPAPKVTSSLVQLRRKDDHLSPEQFARLAKLVKLCFQFRRKTLRNNLKSHLVQSEWLEDSYFDRRPEDLSVDEYWQLTEKFRGLLVNDGSANRR